ncbi:MAG: transcriptional repressor LexA [Vallitalea sp.]|jgi:repressor LexA|nr:transcriptional repressor LexA [Vallitalea sp.]
MSNDLSEKQNKILNFIKKEILSKGYPPSVREICNAVGLKSTSTVHGHLERLEKKGIIRRDPTKPRAIEIIDESISPIRREMVSVPIIGKVAAGEPLLAVENIEEYFPIPTEYMPNKQTFMLNVKGNSMIDAGIYDGDLILVQQQNNADNQDIVVALVDDSVTVKRFFREADHIRLQPENRFMEPIILDDVTILGKVIGLFRRF